MPDASLEPVVNTPYVVVARRYRPQTFGELVGQEHVAEALRGAIETSRVGHAYLFTGARGVGKTSSARILAKCLDCEKGPTITPCNECDICKSVSSGDDVDVLEIDGASNRGIDEIRELRQKITVRPSRARFKIYIIDEVHMLTREAFNALLKTLEEPPEHVKFIFCTTEVEKIPITILSRCQRFDFSGIQPASIIERLQQIAASEGVEVETEALELLARRAAGSMRDSQSLLEQLLSCSGHKIHAADVHRLLGTAGEQRLMELTTQLVNRDAAGALQTLADAVREGVDAGQLIDQLLGFFRDLMVAAVGAGDDQFLYVSSTGRGAARTAAQRLGLDSILAMMQIIEQTLGRMRVSTQGRTLAELALVRICRLEDLESLGALIVQLREGAPLMLGAPASPGLRPSPALPPAAAPAPLANPAKSPPAEVPTPRIAAPAPPSKSVDVAGDSSLAASFQAASKKNGPETPQVRTVIATPAAARDVEAVNAALYEAAENEASEGGSPLLRQGPEAARRIWQTTLERLGGDMTSQHAECANRVAIFAPNRLVVTFAKTYNSSKSYCERVDRAARLEQMLADVAGHKLRLVFELSQEPDAPKAAPATPPPTQRANMQKLYEKTQEPFVQKAVELFKARPTGLTNES